MYIYILLESRLLGTHETCMMVYAIHSTHRSVATTSEACDARSDSESVHNKSIFRLENGLLETKHYSQAVVAPQRSSVQSFKFPICDLPVRVDL